MSIFFIAEVHMLQWEDQWSQILRYACSIIFWNYFVLKFTFYAKWIIDKTKAQNDLRYLIYCLYGKRSALSYHCFMLKFQFAECYAQAISRTKQYERKLGTARKGKRKNKRKPKGT